jgi:lipid A 3-O-deacylase
MKKITGRMFWLIAVVIGLLAICPILQAADEGPLSQKGTKQFGINMGYGYSFNSNRDIRFADVFPYIGYVFTDPVGRGWYRGTVEGIVEGAFSYVFKEQKRYCTGITLMGRYNFIPKSETWRPYVQGGFGMVGTNLKMRNFGTSFNFTSNVAAGILYFWNPCNAVNFEWRYQHISNAGINHDNAGLNLDTLLIGYSHTF